MMENKKKFNSLLKLFDKMENDLETENSDLWELIVKIHSEFGDKEHLCPRCSTPLIPSKISGYKYQCLKCYEDFYEFEAGGRK